MRLLFVSDLHGSDIVFEKSINAISKYNVDCLLLAGDLTSKDLRIILKRDNSKYVVNYRGNNETIDESELRFIKQRMGELGHYYYVCDEEEFSLLKKDESKIHELLINKSLDKLNNWLIQIKERIALTKNIVIITPGNDDIVQIDGLLNEYEVFGIQNNLENSLLLGANEIITVDFTNITPWNTYRELPEDKLEDLIKTKIKSLNNPSKSIFNFHCPPFNTKIDLAPELDKNLKRIATPWGQSTIHVGSKAVRKQIEFVQPLISLHGHIHEAAGEDKIGLTTCINPGSEYWNGIMLGYIVDFASDGTLKDYHRIEA